jgi:nucleoid DNA-binding protein
MRKDDIARCIHQESGIAGDEAATLLDWILGFFKSTLQKGESIMIPNFGTFVVRSKAPRTGRNPRTGEEVLIAAHRTVTFRASPQFKSAINSVQDTNTKP